MVLPTFRGNPAMSIHIFDPLWWSERLYNRRLTEIVSAYSHTISADIGFDTATITFNAQETDIDDWIENGLGRDVSVINEGLGIAWEGFVNRVSMNIGSLALVRGPLMDVGNRVMVVYTPIIDATVDPMVTGSSTETPIAEDTDSQDRYGIIEKVLNGGQLLDDGTTDEAEEIRDLFLEEKKNPPTDEDINIGSSSDPTITLECLGYYYWFTAYIHNDYTASTVTLDTKVKNVLDDDPNSIFSTDQSGVEANAQLTNRLEDTNRFANTVLQELVALGDATDTRWTFSVLEKRKCYYQSIPSEVEYYHRITEPSQNITTLGNEVVNPWDIRAARWIQASDFLVGKRTPATLREDSRVVFIERVTYTAPANVALDGNKTGKLTQRLKQLGIGGA